MGDYLATYQRSLSDPNGFWGDAAAAIDWDTPPPVVLDDGDPPFYRWFTGGRLNTCFNALDRHVAAGNGDRAALIFDSPVTGTARTYSYAELTDEVARFAGVLRSQGVDAGDRVVIYMPMVPEAAIAMLACARLGAVHSVVFGGFAPQELAVRIDDATPTVVVSASCGIEPSRTISYKPLLDEALRMADHQVGACVILQRPQVEAEMTEGRDVSEDTRLWVEDHSARLLRSERTTDRRRAVQALAGMQSERTRERTIEPLFQAAADRDEEVARLAAGTLLPMGELSLISGG